MLKGWILYLKYCNKNNIDYFKQTYEEYVKTMEIVRELYKKEEYYETIR